MSSLAYAAITPVRDEEQNLRRLADVMRAQTRPPHTWVVVENGSTDGTPALARELAEREPWITLVEASSSESVARGGPIVRAFNAGLAALGERPDVIVKLDADVAFEPDYFERVLTAFAADPRLGIASGAAYELEDGEWRRQFMTGASAWGAVRAYRRLCLDDVDPLVERVGWDTVDALKANLAGWEVRTLEDVPFHHHRQEGARDGRGPAWDAMGRCAYFLRYRPSYQLIRTMHRLRRDRTAIRMLSGYLGAAIAREDRYGDLAVTRHLRERQRLRRLVVRRDEALGRAAGDRI
jgi:glycosyltransferase involved in cell wall biosynthesis